MTDEQSGSHKDELEAKRIEAIKNDDQAAAIARREFALEELMQFADELIVQVQARKLLPTSSTLLLTGFKEAIKRLGLVTEDQITTKVEIERQKMIAEFGDEKIDNINSQLGQFDPDGG